MTCVKVYEVTAAAPPPSRKAIAPPLPSVSPLDKLVPVTVKKVEASFRPDRSRRLQEPNDSFRDTYRLCVWRGLHRWMEFETERARCAIGVICRVEVLGA